MSGKAIGTSMNYGYPGTFSRNGDCVIANRLVLSTDTNGPNFGDPCVLNTDNTFSSVADLITASGTFSMTNFAGVAVREVKTMTTFKPAPTLAKYAPGEPCDVIERGSVSVKCNVGTPTAGGKVYVRVTANGSIPAGVVGGFEAAADSSNTVEVTNAKWTTGIKDANGTCELTITSRNLP